MCAQIFCNFYEWHNFLLNVDFISVVKSAGHISKFYCLLIPSFMRFSCLIMAPRISSTILLLVEGESQPEDGKQRDEGTCHKAELLKFSNSGLPTSYHGARLLRDDKTPYCKSLMSQNFCYCSWKRSINTKTSL